MNSIILEAVRKKSSDIHIEPYENHLRIRYRIDGYLYDQPAPPKQLEQALISRLKVMSRLDIAERRLPQDGMAKVRAGEREIDIRVSTVPVAEGERVVLRLLNQSSTLLPLSELGMPGNVMKAFAASMKSPNGIILVTGPTGSGKTTTLYAALRELDTAHLNVMTIEDPIEYQMADIGQIQVKPKIGLTFASGLRHILRQDPDVILVGEIRDQETADIAVRAALTGHLVFSTLHTNDAASAVVRLMDMGIPAYLIASSVRAILAQRLVRRLCPDCRRSAKINDADLDGLPHPYRKILAGQTVYHPAGCGSCLQGYRGRVGLYEIFTVGNREQEEMRKGIDSPQLRNLAAAQQTSIFMDAADKVLQGITSLEEIRRVIDPGIQAAES
jgi:general secretion pathway protein E